jgi:hypothetical protein
MTFSIYHSSQVSDLPFLHVSPHCSMQYQPHCSIKG